MTIDNKQYLENNLAKEDVTQTSSGLQFKILTEGNGKIPATSSMVTVHYSGKLTNGDEFDSSYKRGTPAVFPVNGVIRGWTEALVMMREGSKWELCIPPDLAYGSQGAGGLIPPDSVLVFVVELLEVK